MPNESASAAMAHESRKPVRRPPGASQTPNQIPWPFIPFPEEWCDEQNLGKNTMLQNHIYMVILKSTRGPRRNQCADGWSPAIPLSVFELATNCCENTISPAVADMVKRGQIERKKSGRSWRYRILVFNDWSGVPRSELLDKQTSATAQEGRASLRAREDAEPKVAPEQRSGTEPRTEPETNSEHALLTETPLILMPTGGATPIPFPQLVRGMRVESRLPEPVGVRAWIERGEVAVEILPHAIGCLANPTICGYPAPEPLILKDSEKLDTAPECRRVSTPETALAHSREVLNPTFSDMYRKPLDEAHLRKIVTNLGPGRPEDLLARVIQKRVRGRVDSGLWLGLAKEIGDDARAKSASPPRKKSGMEIAAERDAADFWARHSLEELEELEKGGQKEPGHE